MYEEIIHAVDGIHCVYQLQSTLKMNDLQLKACLAFLHSVGAIDFIDIFDICNIYVLEDFEALCDEFASQAVSRLRSLPHHSPLTFQTCLLRVQRITSPLQSVELVDLRRSALPLPRQS